MTQFDWDNLRLQLEDTSEFSGGLHRPECVLCTATGDVYVSHRARGVSRSAPDGQLTAMSNIAEIDGHELIPNGIAMLSDGSFLIANIGEAGGIWKLGRDGQLTPFLTEVDGQPLSAANFVTTDQQGRVWITVSTTSSPRFKAYSPDVADGFVALVDERGARIVADGLAFTNECRLGPDGAHLYVSETFGRRIRRFAVRPDSLGAGEVFTQLGDGDFPDGCEFDEEGGLWVTSIASNRLYRMDRDGKPSLIIEDSNPAFVAEVEAAVRERRMERDHFYTARGKRLRNIASIAFGGPDRRTAYMGSLLGEVLYSFRSPVPGREPMHWNYAR